MTYDKNRLIRAKISLIMSQPFFATLLMNKPIIENPSIKTARTDGNTIEYNPAFFDTLSHDHTVFVLCHELLHITSFHHTRRQGRDAKKWNHAADYCVNAMLVQSGFSMPVNGLLDKQYYNMSAEQVYNLLPDGGEGDEEEGMGDVTDAPAQTQSEMQQVEAKAKQQLVQALNAAKKAGNIPAGIARLAEALLKPKVPWLEVLPRFMTEMARNDYSFTRPNKRYLHTGFILPSLYSEEIGEIVMIVDTSGSVDEEAMNEVATETNELCSTFGARLKVIFVDSKFQGVQDIEPDEDVNLTAKGGGGTDFKPGFEWMKQNDINPKAVIYFTDLCCSSYPPEPEFPVLWIKNGGYQFYENPPFGEVVEMI